MKRSYCLVLEVLMFAQLRLLKALPITSKAVARLEIEVFSQVLCQVDVGSTFAAIAFSFKIFQAFLTWRRLRRIHSRPPNRDVFRPPRVRCVWQNG